VVAPFNPLAGKAEYRKRDDLARSLGTILAERSSRRGFSQSDMRPV